MFWIPAFWLRCRFATRCCGWPKTRRSYSIDALTPDQFLAQQCHLNRELLEEKLRGQAAARRIPYEALVAETGDVGDLAAEAPSSVGVTGYRLRTALREQ